MKLQDQFNEVKLAIAALMQNKNRENDNHLWMETQKFDEMLQSAEMKHKELLFVLLLSSAVNVFAALFIVLG